MVCVAHSATNSYMKTTKVVLTINRSNYWKGYGITMHQWYFNNYN